MPSEAQCRTAMGSLLCEERNRIKQNKKKAMLRQQREELRKLKKTKKELKKAVAGLKMTEEVNGINDNGSR